MKRVILLITLVVSSINCFADGTTAAIPSNLHIYSTDGAAYVNLPAQGCNTTGMYYLSPDHKAFNSIFSILLSAQMAGKKVAVNFSHCINESNPRGYITGAYLK